MTEGANAYRGLPSVQQLLQRPDTIALIDDHGRDCCRDHLRAILGALRADIAGGSSSAPFDAEAIVAQLAEHIAMRARPGLRWVINSTGIVLHTNLGRAPMAREAIDAVVDIARGYCSLEVDLKSGRRGARTQSIEPLLRELTGAEAALAVNNGAAAILLVLSALAGGADVVVSRGELVEIGGGFRIPDVIHQGGARLVEVGATNKTRIEDYRRAISPDTRVLLKVHQSNFRMLGFTQQTDIGELREEADLHGLAVVVDLGSGLLRHGSTRLEPTIGDALAAGADIVTCSGDKLLGGPQAGLILGRKHMIDAIARHPLIRAVRLDKMSLAALEATLKLQRDTPGKVPLNAMLSQASTDIRARAERLCNAYGAGEVLASDAFTGGGSLPENRIDSFALHLRPSIGAEDAAARLRAGDPAVFARISKGELVLDMLTVRDDELDSLLTALRLALT